MKKKVTLCAVVMMVLVTMPAFGRFSQFVCISPDNPDPQSKIKPVIAFTSPTQDYVTVTVPIIENRSRQYWLIVCKEPLNAKSQNFRGVVQTLKGSTQPLREKRTDVVLIAPLTAAQGDTSVAGSTNNNTNISIQMSLEMAGRSYIYVDYPHIVMDGGYFWAIDIPSFVERLKTRPNTNLNPISGSQ